MCNIILIVFKTKENRKKKLNTLIVLFCVQKWSDCRLDWYAPNFGNITGFVVPYNTVWVPDITLYDK